MRRTTALLALVVAATSLAACHRSADVTLPPAGAEWDYQIGGGYPLPAGATVVSRDRTDTPAAGAYNICYVNGFQTQPDEGAWWLDTHPDLVVRTASGDPLIDPDWPDEMLLDVSTVEKRTTVAGIVGEWIAACRADGFDAVEIDNLDSYTRSDGALDEDDAVAYIRLLADRAHHEGLAIGQKNSAELVTRVEETDLDFAVVEECNRWDECDVFTAGYGELVFIVEYRRSDFDRGCTDWPDLAVVLRDLWVRTPDQSGYVHDAC